MTPAARRGGRAPCCSRRARATSGSDQAVFTIKAAAAKGYTKMGVVYCVEDPTCSNGIQSLIQPGGGSQAGVTTVYSSSISITQPDFTAQCLDAKQAGATFIYFAGDGDSLMRMANDCAAQGYKPLYVGDSIAITANLAIECQPKRPAGRADELPVGGQLHAGAGGLPAGGQAVRPEPRRLGNHGGGMGGGMFAVAADKDLTATPTSAEFFQGLWSIKNNNLGWPRPPADVHSGRARRRRRTASSS